MFKGIKISTLRFVVNLFCMSLVFVVLAFYMTVSTNKDPFWSQILVLSDILALYITLILFLKVLLDVPNKDIPDFFGAVKRLIKWVKIFWCYDISLRIMQLMILVIFLAIVVTSYVLWPTNNIWIAYFFVLGGVVELFLGVFIVKRIYSI